jgi:putative Holliday junction resolvase
MSKQTKNIGERRILALDIGSKRIGVAIWNPRARLAGVRPFRLRKTLKEDLQFFKELIEKEEVETILIGLPVSLGGKITDSTKNALFWVEQMRENFKLPVRTYDESLSSVEAIQIMRDMKKKNKQDHKDSLSAALFLEEFIRAQA